MVTLKLEVSLIVEIMNFSSWQCTIQDYFVQQDLNCALKKNQVRWKIQSGIH